MLIVLHSGFGQNKTISLHKHGKSAPHLPQYHILFFHVTVTKTVA